jgi:hypothetical protein
VTFAHPIIEPHRIAKMAEHMTVAQIAARLSITEDAVEDNLDKAGKSGQGAWELRCHKTGRHWRCHTERACYRKAQMLGLVDYDFGLTDAPVAVPMEAGDIDTRIAEMRGRGRSLSRIALEVDMSATAVWKRLKKMGAK